MATHPKALVITLHAVRKLVAKPKPDVYIRVEVPGIKNEKYTTKPKFNTDDPVFEETLVLFRREGLSQAVVDRAREGIWFHIREKNTFSDKEYGGFKLPLAQFLAEPFPAGMQNKWYTFRSKSKDNLPKMGEICISARFADADTAATEAAIAAAANSNTSSSLGESKASSAAPRRSARTSTITGDEVPNVLVVDVISAKGLRNADGPFGKSDPYAKVYLGNYQGRTKTIVDNHNPIWNQRFQFHVKAPSQHALLIRVKDEDLTGSDILGDVQPLNLNSLKSLLLGETIELTLKLTGRYAKRGSTITIRLEWYYLPSAESSTQTKGRGGIKPIEVPSDSGLVEVGPDGEDIDEDNPIGGETREERNTRLAAEKAELQRLQALRIPTGEYQIQVHLIEARDLKPEDVNGLSDPVVYVTCFDQRKHTAVHRQCTGCVFDQVLFFNIKDVDREIFEAGTIKIEIYDADTFGRNDLIGSYTFDAIWIFYQKDHEIYRRWIGLVDERNPKDRGIQGYLQCSISIVEPGGRIKTHDRAAEQEAEWAAQDEGSNAGDLSSMVLMPPQVKQEMQFLVVNCHYAEDLPRLDGENRGLDPYIIAKIGGNKCQSRIQTIRGSRLCPMFNESLYIPLVVPTMSNAIEVCVLDSDALARDDLCGTVHESLLNCRSGTLGPVWYNLYGSQHTKKSSTAARTMNRQGHLGAHFRGRVLLSMRMDHNYQKNLPERPFKKSIRRLGMVHIPPERVYTLRALCFSGDQLPEFTAFGVAPMAVSVSFGRYEAITNYMKPKDGSIDFSQLLEVSGEYPEDLEQVPDIFLHLWVNPTLWSDPKQICYARLKAKDVFAKGFTAALNPAKWIIFKEDPSMDKLDDNEFPGNLLVRLGFGTSEDAAANSWAQDLAHAKKNTRHPCTLRLNLYQARNIPPCDPDGACDPVVIVRVGTALPQKLPKLRDTTDPVWYKTLDFDVQLDENRSLWPQVAVNVFDWDWGLASNDFVGTARVDTANEAFDYVPQGTDLPKPTWHPLFYREVGDSQGEILCSVQVLRKDDPRHKEFLERGLSVPIKPRTRKAFVEITAFGLRNLKGVGMYPLHAPQVQFDLGSGGNAKMAPKTQASCRPTPASPNFCEIITFEHDMPIDPLFAPRLNMRVVDKTFGGLFTTSLGVAAIDLTKKIPGSPFYEPPQSDSFGHQVPNNDSIQTANPSDGAPAGVTVDDGRSKKRTAILAGDTSDSILDDAGEAKNSKDDSPPQFYINAKGEACDPVTHKRLSPSQLRTLLRKHRQTKRAAALLDKAPMDFDAQEADTMLQSRGPPLRNFSDEDEEEDEQPAESVVTGSNSDGAATMSFSASGEAKAGEGKADEVDAVNDANADGDLINPVIDADALTAMVRAEVGDQYIVEPAGADDKYYDDEADKYMSDDEGLGASGPGDEIERRPSMRRIVESNDAAGVREEYVTVDVAELKEIEAENKAKAAAEAAARGPPAYKFAESDSDDSDHEEEARRLSDETDGASDDHGGLLPNYLKGRQILDCELEKKLGKAPFETYKIFRGQKVGNTILGFKAKSNYRVCGQFKCLIRIVFDQNKLRKPLIDMKSFMRPQAVQLRLYVLRGYRLNPMDTGGTSDPYIKVKLGSRSSSETLKKSKVHQSTNDPLIYEAFTMNTGLPGKSMLSIEAWDKDIVSADDLIGKTTIDLEDRWFNQKWSELGMPLQTRRLLAPKPVEQRKLWTPLSSVPQGKLSMWLDILPAADAKQYPPLEIAPPPKEEWEIRVIVWKTKQMKAEDIVTNMNDLYIKSWLDGEEPQNTDIHWAAKKGGGSFNWRMKFPVMLGGAGDDFPAKRTYLRFQAWDQDVVKWNDCIGESTVDLRRAMVRAFRAKKKMHVFDPDRAKQEKQLKKARKAKQEALAAAAASGGGGGAVKMNDNPMHLDNSRGASKGGESKSQQQQKRKKPSRKIASSGGNDDDDDGELEMKPLLGSTGSKKNKEMNMQIRELKAVRVHAVHLQAHPVAHHGPPLDRSTHSTTRPAFIYTHAPSCTHTHIHTLTHLHYTFVHRIWASKRSPSTRSGCRCSARISTPASTLQWARS